MRICGNKITANNLKQRQWPKGKMIEREWELVKAKAMAKGKDDRKGMGIGKGKGNGQRER